MTIPTYKELPEIKELGARHGWGVFGQGDELGRINLMTPEAVAAAATEVRRGQIFNICLPLNDPEPSWSANRQNYKHTIFSANRNTQDDYIDSFYMQRSTQWDALRHIRAREFGFWGGRKEDEAGPGGTRLGIENWARHGMVGRGVLVDVAAYMASKGEKLDIFQDTPITVDILKATLAKEKVSLKSGDVLMLRTGYMDTYVKGNAEVRKKMSEIKHCPGLHGGEETAEFLWDSGVAAIAADNPAVEDVPGTPEAGSLHRRLIPLLGFALGELFVFGDLAEDCARDGRYTCLFVAVPLNLPGGVGSPGNAVAIR